MYANKIMNIKIRHGPEPWTWIWTRQRNEHEHMYKACKHLHITVVDSASTCTYT